MSDSLIKWLQIAATDEGIDATKKRLPEVWDQYSEHSLADLFSMHSYLMEKLEALKQRKSNIGQIPSEQDYTPPNYRMPAEPGTEDHDWYIEHYRMIEQMKKIMRERRRKDLEELGPTIDELRFRVSVIDNLIWRKTVFHDERLWWDLDQGERDEALNAMSELSASSAILLCLDRLEDKVFSSPNQLYVAIDNCRHRQKRATEDYLRRNAEKHGFQWPLREIDEVRRLAEAIASGKNM